MLPLFMYVLPGFDDLSVREQNVIYNNHRLSTFRFFHFVGQTTEFMLELGDIQPPAFGPVDWAILFTLLFVGDQRSLFIYQLFPSQAWECLLVEDASLSALPSPAVSR